MKSIALLFSIFFSLSFYGQNDTLTVVRHTDNDIITPKNLKVVFRGISNELFIDVPNSKSFEISGNGITKVSKNIYNLNPGGGSETSITVEIVLKNNKKITEKHFFKIRNVPSIVGTFNRMEGGIIKVHKNAFKDAVIGAKIEDKNIEDIIEEVQFTIKIPGMGAIVISGNKIDNKTYEKIIKNTSTGDQITIFDIKIRFTKLKAMCGETSPMIIQIL